MSVDIAFTPAGAIYPSKLAKELRAVIPGFHSVTVDDDTYIAAFDAALTAEEQTQFDDIVAAHDPTKPVVPKIIVTGPSRPEVVTVSNKTEWEKLLGSRSSPGFFEPNLALVVAQVAGEYLALGDGLEMRVVERHDDGTIHVLRDPAMVLPNTNERWAPFALWTNVPPTVGFHSYRFEARLGGATLANVQEASINMFKYT